jgi:hypothetical protein
MGYQRMVNARFRRQGIESARAGSGSLGLHGLAEGQKLSFEAKTDPRRGKTSAENLKAL